MSNNLASSDHTKSSNTPADDDEASSSGQTDPRRSAELMMVHTIMRTVEQTTRAVNREGRQEKEILAETTEGGNETSSSKIQLTDLEAPVFNRYTYFGWTYAGLAGFAVLGTLFGGMRLVSYRRALKDRAMPGSASYHARTSSSRSQYLALDRPTTVNTAMANSAKRSNTAPATRPLLESKEKEFVIFSEDVIVQIQFMMSAAVALLTGITVGSMTRDRDGFHRDLAALPLQSGKSVLCHRMCPLLVKQHTELLAMDSIRPVFDAIVQEQGEQKVAPSVLERILRGVPRELWNDPVSDELEAMAQLVENCRQRVEFEDECRRRRHRVDEDGLVDVPEPGVPVRFIKSGEASE